MMKTAASTAINIAANAGPRQREVVGASHCTSPTCEREKNESLSPASSRERTPDVEVAGFSACGGGGGTDLRSAGAGGETGIALVHGGGAAGAIACTGCEATICSVRICCTALCCASIAAW